MTPPHDPGLPEGSAHASDDQILDLAHGLASPENEPELMAHVRSCASCEERLRQAAAERERLRAGPLPRVQNDEVVLTAPAPTASPRSRPRILRWLLPVGAVAVAAALALLLLPRGSDVPPVATDPPTAERWIPVDQALTLLRSNTGAEAAELRAALEVYKKNDVKEALAFLENARVPEDAPTYASLRRIFLADLRLRDGQPADQVLELLDEVDLPTLPEPWRREGRWVRYQALHADGRHAECLALLELLQNSPGEIGELARAALRAQGSGPGEG